MRVEEKQFKKFIVDSGLISENELSKASAKAAKKGLALKEILLSENGVSEDDLRRIEAYVLGVPFVNLKEYKIDFAVLSMIPEPIARKHNIVSFKKTDNELEVAMLDTDDLAAIDFVKKKVGYQKF